MKRFYSPSTGAIYTRAIYGESIPGDAVELTNDEFERLTGGVPKEMNREGVEAARLRSYADPLTGSDRYFSEAARMQAMGEEGWQEVREFGVSRYQEIQQQFPWPEA